MLRGILNIGRQDIDPCGLIPLDINFSVLGATSDHTIIDLTHVRYDAQVGDLIAFNLTYSAMLAAMTSPYVTKILT